MLVDSLARELTRAQATLEAMGRPTAGRHDTLRVGALTVLAPSDRVAIAAAGMEEAWARLTEHLGAAAEALAHDTMEVRLLQPGVPMLAGEHRALAIRNDATAEVIVARIYEIVTDMIFDGRDDSVRVWLRHQVPFAHETQDLASETYRQLATSLSVAAERCYLGDLSWCREALGLVPTENPAQRWYDAGGRRALVSRLHQVRYRTAGWTDHMVEQCTERGSDAACSALLADLPRYVAVPEPLGSVARQQLFVTALARGGAGAIDRLLVADGTLLERLARAAGEPSDSLLAAWRAGVLAAAPPPPVVTPGTRWIALAWIGLLVAVAVSRTRWI